ncbi:MAG: PAS domain-containing protein [Thermodesulfobacteriota bacterium]
MQYERWDDYLVAEHEMIERAMEVMRQALDNLEETAAKPLKLSRAVDFLLEFGDRIHNRKEEDYLFPLMEERGIPKSGGPLGVMLQEHKMERELLTRMLQDLPALRAAGADDREAFRRRGVDYLQIRAEHIWKENDVLYPMARRVFQEGDGETLLARFAEVDVSCYGAAARDRFRQMLVEVEQGGSGPKKLIENLSYAQLHAIMETMPFEVTFVDAEDSVAYFNRLDREKLFPRTRSVIGRKVEKCHPQKSVATVHEIVEGFRNRTRTEAQFWINFRGDKVLIRYFPVYDDEGAYLGVLEITQAVGWIRKLEGEKRLLD